MTKTASLGKPKPKGGTGSDGQYTFQMPSKEQMDEQRGGGARKKLPDKTWHIGRCTNVTFKHAESSGNPMWEWDFAITKGEYAGTTWKLWTALTDAAAWKVMETLEALGQDCPAGEQITLNKKEVIGVGCQLFIVDDDRNDEFSKLDKIKAHPQGAGFKPGKGLKQAEVEEEGGEEEEGAGEEEEGVEEVEERPARRTAPPAAKRGKAPVSLGKKR